MALWMWQYGDFELYHFRELMTRRERYDRPSPPVWELPPLRSSVIFIRDVVTERDCEVTVYANCTAAVEVDGSGMHYPGERFTVFAGAHRIRIIAVNTSGLPAVYVDSDLIPSGTDWYTVMNGKSFRVGCREEFSSPADDPEVFKFSYEEKHPVSVEKTDAGTLYDFGRELFGNVMIDGVDASDELYVGYGESREEALDVRKSIVFEHVTGEGSYKLRGRAFRYIYIEGAAAPCVTALFEYLPLEERGSFRCSVDAVNEVWDVCAYTFLLNCREAILDGIKRDRWVWSGDAYQGYKINSYLYFDRDLVRRTTLALGGKPPYTVHINTILDYSLYWVIGLYDYYMNYGDADFIEFLYPNAADLMDFVATRENAEGFIEGKEGDWVFIDWTEMDKQGAVCAEQMLYAEALRTMARLAALVGEDGEHYASHADSVIKKINDFYWDTEKGAYIDSYVSGKRSVTRHANIFAVLYGIADAAQTESIVENVLLNDNITKITTPYFKGFELDVLAMLGMTDEFEKMLDSYWHGMIRLGATTVWEEFDPTQTGTEHYAMYGDKYGKSLCHAWGATPIYLLGKYYLGVYPTAPGFERYKVEPRVGGLGKISGTVPVCGGEVRVETDGASVTVFSSVPGGTLVWRGAEYPIEAGKTLSIS